MVDFSSIALILFILITIFYYIFIYFLGEKNKNWIRIVYYILVIGTQILMGYFTSKDTCGTPQISEIFIWSLLPWFIIFIGFGLILEIMPSWKQPFSNTFGYLVTRLMGIKELLNKILKSNYTSKNQSLNKIMEDIYEDNSLLINKFTPDNFDFTINNLKQIFNTKQLSLFKNEFKQLVLVKDMISEFIWYIMIGILTSSMSSMGLLSSHCKKSVKQIENEVNKYKEQIKTTDQQNKNKPNKKYFIRD
jgi:hypothetical protein